MKNSTYTVALTHFEYEHLRSSLLLLDKIYDICVAMDELILFQMAETHIFGGREAEAFRKMKFVERKGFRLFLSELAKKLNDTEIGK